MKSTNYTHHARRQTRLILIFLALAAVVSPCGLFSEVKQVEEVNNFAKYEFNDVNVALDGGSIVLSVEKPSGGLTHLLLLNKRLQRKYGQVAMDEHVFWGSGDRRFKEYVIIEKGSESESSWVKMITSAKENSNSEITNKILEQFSKLLKNRKTNSRQLHEAVSKHYDEKRRRQD